MFSFFFIIAIPGSLQDILLIFFKYFFIFFQLRNYQWFPILAQNSKKEKYLFFILILQLNIFIYFFTFFDFLQYSSFSFKFLLATQCLKLQHFFNSLPPTKSNYVSHHIYFFKFYHCFNY